MRYSIALRRYETAKNLYGQKHYTAQEYSAIIGEVMTDIFLENKFGKSDFTLEEFVSQNQKEVEYFKDYDGCESICSRLEDLGYYDDSLQEEIISVLTMGN